MTADDLRQLMQQRGWKTYHVASIVHKSDAQVRRYLKEHSRIPQLVAEKLELAAQEAANRTSLAE